ncbi:MAG: cupin domain-containing protein [Candidatus Peregrinibacteria bacterium]
MQLPLCVDLSEKMEAMTEPWIPLEIARCNGQVVRLAKFEGSYHWHVHTEEDELFFVVKGQITIQIRGQAELVLSEGQIAVIPRGMEHCPSSKGQSFVLMMEPATLNSTGN